MGKDLSSDGVLIITSKIDVTADLIVLEIKARGRKIVRFNVEDFPKDTNVSIYLEGGKFQSSFFLGDKSKIDLAQIKSVYYRPHEPPETSKLVKDELARKYAEEQSAAALDYLWDSLQDKLWVSPPRSIRRATSKTLQLAWAIKHGIDVPKTLITNDSEEFKRFYKSVRGKVLVKNLTNEGMVQQLPGYIYSNKVSSEDLKRLPSLQLAPVLCQEYIDKKLEIRATVIGKKVFSAAIDSQSRMETEIDWRQYDLKNPPPHRPFDLSKKLENKLITMVENFGLKFGAFDLILTPEDKFVFLELNANAQWGWIQFMTGLKIKEAIVDLLLEDHV